MNDEYLNPFYTPHNEAEGCEVLRGYKELVTSHLRIYPK
jgi:hypothetical protein